MKKTFPCGFTLVEVALALGVASFCFVTIFALLPIGVNLNHTSIEQTAATNLISAVISDLRSTPKTATVSPRYAVAPSGSTTLYLREDGTTGTVADARYRLQVTLAAPTTGKRIATKGRILVSWPGGQSDPAKAIGSVESFVALDRN